MCAAGRTAVLTCDADERCQRAPGEAAQRCPLGEDPLDCPTPTFSRRCPEPRATLWQRLKYSTLQILFLQGTGLCQVWLESEKQCVPPAACVCDCRPAMDSSLMPMDGTGGPTAAHKALHTLHHLLQLQLLHPFLLFGHSLVSNSL